MKTLLYVDDDETIGRVVARYFTKRGDVALIAHSLAEARTILETEEPDAVFVDVWLGSESGFELLGWIENARPRLKERVTFVTGELADADFPGRLWKTLDRPVIQKPFELSRLAESLDHAHNRAGT